MTEMLRLCAAESTASNVDWEIVGATVFTGISVVFLILALLILFFIIMGKIFQAIEKRGQKAAAEIKTVAPAQPSAPAPVPVEEPDDEDDEEIIAVIAAAIAAYSAADGKQYRITSVKKRGSTDRSAWKTAGLAENTRGFLN